MNLRPTTSRLGDAKLYDNASRSRTAKYDFDNPRYPYKSRGQWLKAYYASVSCLLLFIFNGVEVFLEKSFDTRRFIASYASAISFSTVLIILF